MQPIIKYMANMDGLIYGASLFWLDPPEIHIAAELQNTPVGAMVLNHELTHLKFAGWIKKYPKIGYLIIILNNIFDIIDSFLIFFVQIWYFLRSFQKN